MVMASNDVSGTERAGHGQTQSWFDSRRLKLLAFYLGVPVTVGIYGALNNWELLREAGYVQGIGFYLAHSLPPWMVTCLMTTSVMYALRQWKPSPWVIMGIGSVIAAFIVAPALNWLTGEFEARWGLDGMHDQVAPMLSASFWRYLTTATIMWFLVNFIFDRFLGLPRYRYTLPRGYDFKEAPKIDAERPAGSLPLPNFLTRAPNALEVDDVLAIKAEQHYIRLITEAREYMLLYRFSDAVNELEPSVGQQVHRSFWVNNTAIDSVRPRAKKFILTLTNGFEVPVSGPYHAVVKEFARVNGIKVLS